MRAANLRQKIRFERYETDNSNIEYPKRQWVEHCTVHADVQDLSTRDSMVSQQVGSFIVSRAIVRYSKKTSEITFDMRAVIDGVYYQVNGKPKHDLGDRRTYLTIELKEGLKEWQ